MSTGALKHLSTDPEKAYELTKKLFSDHPNILTTGFKASYPGGSSWWGNSHPELNSLIDQFVLKDPARLMTDVISLTAKGDDNTTIHQVGAKWVRQDIAGYAKWLDQQTDPELRTSATSVLTGQLASMGQHEEAMEWLEQLQLASANSTPGNAAIHSLTNSLESWDSTKLAELTKLFANMPAHQKDRVASLLLDHHIDRGLKGEMIRHVAMQPDRPDTEPDSSDPFSGSAQNITSIASSHVVQWAQHDPEGASQWVRTLPQGEAKLWAQKNLASNWALYDPEAANAWVKSLPADARQEVRAFLDGGN